MILTVGLWILVVVVVDDFGFGRGFCVFWLSFVVYSCGCGCGGGNGLWLWLSWLVVMAGDL